MGTAGILVVIPTVLKSSISIDTMLTVAMISSLNSEVPVNSPSVTTA